jgi:hypothetical protein
MLNIHLVDSNGGSRQSYKIGLSPKGIATTITLVVSLIGAIVVASNRFKQVPINTKRITCIEKQTIKIRAEAAGNRVLLESLIKKQYPSSSEVIINQASEIAKSLEEELETIYTKEVK